MIEVKFCGLTLKADVRAAVATGARYVGMILTSGPRSVTAGHAKDLIVSAGGARIVGVFGDDRPEIIAALATALGLDIVQLHADPTPKTIAAVRRHFPGEVWATARIGIAGPPSNLEPLFESANAVVLDTLSRTLGGSGRSFDWNRAAPTIAAARSRGGRLVLAGGLTPSNVVAAIDALRPDVVDVSSGVERSPGVKDHAQLRAFARAVELSILGS